MKKTALIAAVALGASAVLSVAGVSSASAAGTRACIILPDADSGRRPSSIGQGTQGCWL